MSPQSPTRILLIEDNPGDARLLREMFNEHGSSDTELTHVETMREAERYLAACSVDIILLDLGLPDAEGVEAVRRAHAAAPQVPLVVLTIIDDESLAVQALQEGAQDYLIKGQIESGLLRALRYAIERKMMEQSHGEMEAQLRQAHKMEAVGQLAAGVAHEFNNLLQALMSMAAIIRLSAGTPEVAQLGTEMESQIKRGASLTQQLLQFSRHRTIEKAELDLGEQVQKASALLRQLIPENIRIVVEISPERLSIEGDAGQMQQVLLNLAINARDAMPEGGDLILRAGSSGGELFLDVEDTGHGMDESTRAHLFEPFFTTKEIGKGTGLGLAVAHGIIEQHGGRIEVYSRPGEGCRFHVILPIGSCESAPALQPAADDDLALASGHVLLVEDEDQVRIGITALLQMIGYEVTAVRSGEEAIATALTPAPDLLLSDVTLHGMTGLALGEELRQRWPSLRIVLMSGYIEDSLRAKAGARFWDVLQKPFDMSDLASHLRAALGNSQFRERPTPPPAADREPPPALVA